MNNILKKLSLSALAAGALGFALPAQAATVLTFDDLVGAGAVPTNYAGLTWTGWAYYDDSQPPYNASSPDTRIYNDPRTNANRIEFNQEVTFLGLWIAGYSTGQYVIGYNQGNPIFTSTPQLNDFSEFGNFVSVNWAGVDAISIFANQVDGIEDHYIIDDVRFDDNRVGVPEGGTTIVLLGGAFCMLGAASRRLRK